MGGFRSSLKHRIRTRLHVTAWRFLGVGLFVIFALQAKAGFIGYYDPTNFTLVNTQADGFVTTPGDGSSVTVTGGNDGSGFFGTTDFLIIAPLSGIVTFRYLFTTLDTDQFGDLFDDAGFLTNGQFTPFSQLLSPDPVPAIFFVAAGDAFGFRVETLDNLGEPGILTVSDFNAPQPAEAPAPEPSLGILVLLGIGAGAAWKRRQMRLKETA